MLLKLLGSGRAPVAGGLLVIGGGVCLLILPGGSLAVVLLPGLAGTSGFLFGAGLCVLGLFLVLQPRSHAFAGVAAILVALTSLVTTNLGGFGLGVALGVLGGALGFAWEPGDQSDRVRSPRVPDDRRRGPGGQAPVEPPTQPIRSTGPDPTTRRTLHGRVPDR